MKSASRIALVFLLVPALLTAQTKKKHTLPAAFGSARYVFVESRSGDLYTPGLLPEDRQAIMDVQDALHDWNRYTLTTSRSDAELVFTVRKGRIASARIGGSGGVGNGPLNQPYPSQRPVSDTGAGQPLGSGRGVDLGAEGGPPDDWLQVRLVNTDGNSGASLWERTFPEGLDAPRVPLIEQLKKAVEKDYPLNPPPAKP